MLLQDSDFPSPADQNVIAGQCQKQGIHRQLLEATGPVQGCIQAGVGYKKILEVWDCISANDPVWIG